MLIRQEMPRFLDFASAHDKAKYLSLEWPICPAPAILRAYEGGRSIVNSTANFSNCDAAPSRACEDLATRYLDLVYASAMRQTRDPHTAADVTQAVFVILARRIGSKGLPKEAHMAGWLLKVTRYTIKEARRAAMRRAYHERRAAAPAEVQPSVETEEITALLDESILRLGTLDREVLLRRYLQGQGVKQVAAAVGLSENAAGHRLARALEKLRKLLARRGVVAPAALLAIFAAQTAARAPAGTLGMPCGSAASSLADHVLRRMAMAKIMAASILATAAIIAIGAMVGSLLPGSGSQSPVPALAGPVAPPDGGTRLEMLLAGAPAAPSNDGAPTLTVTSVVEEGSDKLLRSVLASIEENRRKLHTMEIHSAQVEEIWDPQLRQWMDHGSSEGTAWIEAAEPQRMRVEMARDHAVWGGGAAPFLDESYTEAWDGTTTRQVYADAAFSARRGLLGNKTILRSKFLIGGAYSLQLQRVQTFDANGARGDENPLAPDSLKTSHPSVRRVVLNGKQAAVELTVGIFAKGFYRYWFDAAHGYALLGAWYSPDGRGPRYEYVTDEIVEAAPGVYYPVKAHSLGSDGETPPTRQTFIATKVIANAPLPPQTFSLPFAPDLDVSEVGDDHVARPTTRR